MSVSDEGYYRNVSDEGYYRNVSDEGYYRNVSDEGYYRNVSDEGYSSHVLIMSVTWWRLFQKRVVYTKLDIYVFIDFPIF